MAGESVILARLSASSVLEVAWYVMMSSATCHNRLIRAHYPHKSLVQCSVQCPHLLPCLRGAQLLVVGDVGEGEAAEDAESLDKALVVGGEDPGLLVDERHHADNVLIPVPERSEFGKNI